MKGRRHYSWWDPYVLLSRTNGINCGTIVRYRLYSTPNSFDKKLSSSPMRSLNTTYIATDTAINNMLFSINARPGTMNTMKPAYIGFRERPYTPVCTRRRDSNARLTSMAEEIQKYTPMTSKTMPIQNIHSRHGDGRDTGDSATRQKIMTIAPVIRPVIASNGPIPRIFILQNSICCSAQRPRLAAGKAEQPSTWSCGPSPPGLGPLQRVVRRPCSARLRSQPRRFGGAPIVEDDQGEGNGQEEFERCADEDGRPSVA